MLRLPPSPTRGVWVDRRRDGRRAALSASFRQAAPAVVFALISAGIAPVRHAAAHGDLGSEERRNGAFIASWPDAVLQVDRILTLLHEHAPPLGALERFYLELAGPPQGSAEHHSPVLWIETARELATNDVGISFRSLWALPPSAARELARCRGFLHFERLRELDPRAACLLVGSRTLRFDNLVTLDSAAAMALGAHKGPLALNAVEHLGDEAIEGLARHEGFLALNGLVALGERAAEALARHDGPVCLNGVTTLSCAAATALARSRHGLALNGLREVDDRTVAALARHAGPWLLCKSIGSVQEARQAAAVEAAVWRDRAAPQE